jgi:RNA polymerase sigma-70 factor (ECF subfamily)
MYRCLLVANQYVTNFVLLEQLIVNKKDCAPRIAEKILDLFFLETPHYNLGTRQNHCDTRQVEVITDLSSKEPAKLPAPAALVKARSLTGPVNRDRFSKGNTLSTRSELSDFLASVERRAFKQAQFAVRDEQAALDIVQDAMMRLAEKYGQRPATEFPMLFQRILQNAVRDHHRRQKVRNLWVSFFSAFGKEEDEDFDLLETLESEDDSKHADTPHGQYQQNQMLAIIEHAIERLPARQREAFLMRYWEEMDIAETAAAMGCSEGSVKTHCSRAVHTLAAALREKGIEL